MAPVFAPIMGAFVVLSDYLVVGGGGGGHIGGGGGGGVRIGTNLLIKEPVAVTVGAGGAVITQGNPSSIGSLVTALGGGAGANGNTSGAGGGGGWTGAGGTGLDGANGGTGDGATHGGGGGGGGPSGTAGSSASVPNGGNGTVSSIFGGTYGGGGGGGLGGVSTGGTGGGGNGGNTSSTPGAPNTGGGGGGVVSSGPSPGGSGVVFTRYVGAPQAISNNVLQYSGYTYHLFYSGTETFTPRQMSQNGNDYYTKLLLHFDGANGTQGFVDSSQFGHLFSNVQGVTHSGAISVFGAGCGSSNGTVGWRLDLDGSSDFAFGTGNFTIDFWFQAPSAGTRVLFDCRPTGTQGPYPTIYMNSPAILTYYTNSADRIVAPSNITANQWYHLMVERYAGTTRMFLDGTQIGSDYVDGNNYLNGANRPTLFATGFGTGNEWNGYMDEVRVSKGISRSFTNFTRPSAPYS